MANPSFSLIFFFLLDKTPKDGILIFNNSFSDYKLIFLKVGWLINVNKIFEF